VTRFEQDQALIDEIDGADANLDSKEADFIDSCLKRLALGQTLSDKQRKWAQDILERIG
jgi:ribosome assembly protein YihI (activator of Der GTPase)